MALVAAPGVVVLVGQWLLVRPVFIDDSYIFYRYADNWADGLGPVFNRGEHVEGFTSFLWLALVALGSRLGAAPEDLAPVLGLVAAVAVLPPLAAAAVRLLPGMRPLAAGVVLAAAIPTGVSYYAASGMDAPLFALVLTGAVLATAALVERGSGVALACALLACLVVVRAEGIVYAAVIVAVAVALGRRREAGARAPVAPLVAAAGLAALVVVGVRVAVYDSLVPATVSAKGAATHHLRELDLGGLAEVIRAGLRYEGVVLLGLAAAVVAGLFLRRRSPIPPLVLIGAAVVALNLAISVWAGGDWMSHRRHVVPVLPLLALVAAWTASAAGASRPGAGRLRALAGGAAACVLTVVALGFQPSRLEDASGGAEPGYLERIGEVTRATPDTKLLTNVAGVLPYRAGVDTYTWDLLGLTDEHNSREGDVFTVPYGRTDYDYSFGRDWDLLVTNSVNDADALFDRLDRGRGYGPMEYLESEPWLAERVSVLVRPGAPIATALRIECRCRPVPLTPANRARIARKLGLPPRGG